MPFTSSTTGSFTSGRRASTTTFAGLAKTNKLIVHYDPSNSDSYGGSGTTLSDLTSNNYDGTIVGGPSHDTNHFTLSANDYFVTPDISSDIPSDDTHTVELWFYPTGDNGVLVQYQGQSAPNSSYHFSGIELVSGQLEFALWNGSGLTSSGPTGSVTLNTWHQVVLTYDGSHIRGFLDGVRVCKTAVTFDSPSDGVGSESSGSAFHLAVGPDTVTNQGDGSDFEGDVGIFRVYNARLNRSAILRNYKQSVDTYAEATLWDPENDITPALWYDASDTSSYTLSSSTLNTVTDKAGNFTVTVDGSPTRISSGLNSLNVWDFDGSESLITGSGPYTSSGNHWAIGVFQYHSTDSTKDSFFSADGTRTYAVSSAQSNNTWTGEIDYDGSNSIVTGTAKNDFTTSVSINTWVIVSIVFNKTGNQIFGRINGTTATSTDAYNLAMDTNASDVRMMRNRAGVRLDGRMAEYFHVAGVPGTGGTDITDVEKAEGYIAHKWGLEGNLPAGHPYKSSAPTV